MWAEVRGSERCESTICCLKNFSLTSYTGEQHGLQLSMLSKGIGEHKKESTSRPVSV